MLPQFPPSGVNHSLSSGSYSAHTPGRSRCEGCLGQVGGGDFRQLWCPCAASPTADLPYPSPHDPGTALRSGMVVIEGVGEDG